VNKPYPGLLKDAQSQLIRIFSLVIDIPDPGIADHLGAEDTGLVSDVKGTPPDTYSIKSSLDNGILLSMETTAELMALPGGDMQLLAQAADFAAVLQSCRSTIVSSAENSLLFDNNSPHLASQAG
jgi:hypothetical protein